MPGKPLAPSSAERPALRDPAWVRWTLVALALAFLALFVALPLATVFVEALRRGFAPYFNALAEPDALSAIRLTLLVAGIAGWPPPGR